MPENTIKYGHKLWLSNESGDGILGGGKIHLLEKIREAGSLSAAAESMGISYRKAWGDLKKAEQLLGFDLTLKTRGGAHGGKSELTLKAVQLLAAYEGFQADAKQALDIAFINFLEKIN